MANTSPPARPTVSAALMTAVLVLLTVLAYTGLWWWSEPGQDPLTLFGSPDGADVLSGFAEVTVAVLGIAITVVAIIVELAANRYTPRITELFVRDPINVTVLSFYAITAVLVVGTSMSLHGPNYPAPMVQVAVLAMGFSIISLLPYLLYVFDFLTPERVIYRIQVRALRGLKLASRNERHIRQGRAELRNGVEQLGDILLNSIHSDDKAIAIATLNALLEIGRVSALTRDQMPAAWFNTRDFAIQDQDFVSFHQSIIDRLAARKTWVEVKVLRQYLRAYSASVVDLQDIAHIVAIHTRRLAGLAVDSNSFDVFVVCRRFLHTYFRESINLRNVRSTYNVFNEYRTLAQSLFGSRFEGEIPRMVSRTRLYGQLGFQRSLPFILETAAYDCCALLETAYVRKAPSHVELLELFLSLDREPDGGDEQEASLRGVRKAQVKLATFYLANDGQSFARRIFDDMKDEKRERIQSIWDELSEDREQEFWEVNDRGVDFDWMPMEQIDQLDVFFGWFELE